MTSPQLATMTWCGFCWAATEPPCGEEAST
jgi:hypothetical protein